VAVAGNVAVNVDVSGGVRIGGRDVSLDCMLGGPLAEDLLSGLRRRVRRALEGDGILATKLGYNPNSSSLGVDVTFLLFGMSSIALLTPVISLLLRRSKPSPP
jgi:hypothetical protein